MKTILRTLLVTFAALAATKPLLAVNEAVFNGFVSQIDANQTEVLIDISRPLDPDPNFRSRIVAVRRVDGVVASPLSLIRPFLLEMYCGTQLIDQDKVFVHKDVTSLKVTVEADVTDCNQDQIRLVKPQEAVQQKGSDSILWFSMLTLQ